MSGAARPALVLLLATAWATGLGACGSARHSHGMDERQGLPALVKEPPAPPASDVPVPARPQEKAFGARYATPEQCEVAARALLPTARDQAWADLNAPHVTPDGEDAVRLSQLRQAFFRLPTDQREALHLVAVEGTSFAEAASILGVPAGTVMSRVARARDALRQMEEGTARRPALRLVGETGHDRR